MAETDPQRIQRSYLASEDAFRIFRRYQPRNRIVPLELMRVIPRDLGNFS